MRSRLLAFPYPTLGPRRLHLRVRPFTPQVEWHKADALEPATYAHLLPGAGAVVHTIGTLFERSGYKGALRDGSVPRFVGSVAGAVACGGDANPLEREDRRRAGSYAVMNRDSGASPLGWAGAGRGRYRGTGTG